VKGMFPVRLGILEQLCAPFVCRSSSGGMGDGDTTSRLTVGPSETSAFAAFEEPLWAKCGPVVARESRLE
jgi:hypothetical protein